MNLHVNNVTALPSATFDDPVVTGGEEADVSVIVISPRENDKVVLKYILGDACRVTICSSLQGLSRLIRSSGSTPPTMVLVRESLFADDPTILSGAIKRAPRLTPILVLKDKWELKCVARYMESGIRAVVSLDDADLLRAIISREIEDHRVRCAYDRTTTYLTRVQTASDPNSQNTWVGCGTHDQLCTRPEFIDKFTKRIAVSPTRGVRALAWFRPDRFTSVQDLVGILSSEEALQHVGLVLQELAHPADLCGRFGGTIFAAVIDRGTMQEVEAWVQQFCRCLEDRPFVKKKKTVQLSCSVGICEIANNEASIERILKEAHDANNRGRIMGDGQICLSASSKSAESTRLRDRKWAHMIRRALQRNRFQLSHSPVVRLDGSDDKIRDTWLRMTTRKGKIVLASEFLPVARRLGLMTNIDRWVVAATITYCVKRDPDLVFVRLSKSSMLDDSLTPWLQTLFDKSTVDASRICFQTTATVAARHLKQTIRQVHRLASQGFRFSIDQVGSTPEMMEVLQLVPAQFARIDPTLLQKVAWDRKVHQQISSILNACRSRSIHAIADRVEDAATMATLCQLGVEFMQGDYVRRDTVVMEDTATVCIPTLPPTVSP